MNVAIVLSVDPRRPTPSGTRRFAASLRKHMAEAGQRPFVVCPCPRPEEQDGAVYVPSPAASTEFRFALRLAWAWWRRRIRLPADTVILCNAEHHCLPFVVPRRHPVVLVSHGYTGPAVTARRGRLLSLLYAAVVERFAVNGVDALVAVSDEVADYYRRRYPRRAGKVRTVVVGVDEPSVARADRAALRQRLGLPAADPIVLYVGRLSREKNVPLILDAFRRVRQASPSARLLIVGEGKERGALRARAAGLPVSFLGSAPYERVVELMRAADVVAIASMTESGPLVMLEALACGTPVVSTPVGRAPHVLTDRRVGRLAPFDVGEYAAALAEVLRLDRAAVEAACRAAAGQWTFRQTYQGIQAALDEVASSYASRSS